MTDTLQAVIAELRDRTGHYDYCNCDSCSDRKEWADRLERIDAEHGLTVGLYEGIVRLREDCIEELRERLAAAERALQKLVSVLPDTREMLIAREDALFAIGA